MNPKGYRMRILLSCLAGMAMACDSATGPGKEHFELAFTRSEAGELFGDIYVSRADGSHATRLTTGAGAFAPRWSPDGTRIAFVTNLGKYSLIEWISADAADRGGFAQGRNPAWSPDGTQIGFTGSVSIVFPCCSQIPTNVSQIFTVRTDGSNLRQIAPDSAYNTMGSWSPDGKRIAFTRFVPLANAAIFVMAADGSDQVRLTYNPGMSDPVWSPTGAKIAFVGFHDPHYAIYTMNPDGSDQTQVTSGTTDDVCPTWSPDGSRIAFTSNRDGFFQIYLMNADGSNQVRIGSDFSDACPSWKSP